MTTITRIPWEPGQIILKVEVDYFLYTTPLAFHVAFLFVTAQTWRKVTAVLFGVSDDGLHTSTQEIQQRLLFQFPVIAQKASMGARWWWCCVESNHASAF